MHAFVLNAVGTWKDENVGFLVLLAQREDSYINSYDSRLMSHCDSGVCLHPSHPSFSVLWSMLALYSCDPSFWSLQDFSFLNCSLSFSFL